MAVPSNPFALEQRAVEPGILRSVRQASRSSASDFGLLMAEASQESGFHANARAAHGSAQGLYQFVDSTWLDMVHRFGAKYGVGALAQEIKVTPSGHLTTTTRAARQQILALRNDPSLSASLAGEYANMNKSEVERALGRSADAADLYMAHFLGPAGATQFLKALATNGSTEAASLLPEAAENNRAVFFDSATGRPKTVAEIYNALGGRIEQEAEHYDAADTADDTATADADIADATRVASTESRTNFAGLHLTAPVAAMLDTLTLAAIHLANGATSTQQSRRSQS